jgi:hypothetical protein
MAAFPALPDEPRLMLVTRADRVDYVQVGNGYAVRIMVAPPSSDDLWETVTLPVRYSNPLQAQRKAEVIRETGKIDLRLWTWQPSAASPFGWMHHTPVAKWVDAPARYLTMAQD